MTLSATFNDSGISPARLFAAVEAGSFKAVRTALEAGVAADSRDADGNTPLMLAAAKGNLALVGMLLGYGAEVNAKNASGETPLDKSLTQSNVDLHDLLLSSGADPMMMRSREFDNLLALRSATRGADKSLAALLGQGVSRTLTDENNASLLVLAAGGGHAEAVETLLKSGANLHQRNKEGRSPLGAAMRAKSLDCVNLLLAAGADPGLGDLFGTPSSTDHGFSQQCDPEIAAAVDKAYQKFILINAALDGDDKKVAELIAKGEPVNVFNYDGVTALTCACNQQHPKVVRLLLDHQADPNLATKKCQSPVSLAITKGDAHITAMLIKAGAIPAPTALHEACGKKYTDIVKILLDYGMDPNITARSTQAFSEPADFFITTTLKVLPDDYPLHTAIRNLDTVTAAALTASGARTVSKDAEGLMALQLARHCGSDALWEIVKARHDQEMEMLAASSVQLSGQTNSLKTLKFKTRGPG